MNGIPKFLGGNHNVTNRRPLAFGAALAIGFGSLFAASPAMAEDAETPIDQQVADTGAETTPAETEAPAEAPAETTEAPAEDAQAEAPTEEEAATLEEAGVELVATGTNAAGETVVAVIGNTDDAKAEKAITSFAVERGADSAENVVTVELPKAPEAWADDEFVGGQGYAGYGSDDYLYACSIGFTAYTAAGDPAFLGAGHCAFNQGGAQISTVALTQPNQEPAVGGEGYVFPGGQPTELGQFVFAQFGGPNGTVGADGDENSTDVSLVDVTSDTAKLVPAVTDWTSAGATTGSAADSAVKVKNVGAAAVGEVSKSGRTTGFTTGAVRDGDILDGWSTIEDRWVRGFSSNVKAGPGDSGGSVIQGQTAVGLISGGVEGTETQEQWTWSTSLRHALAFTDGAEVALDIDAPVVQSPVAGATVEPGSDIVVAVADNATDLDVSFRPNTGETVPVNDATVTLTAPTEPGEYTLRLTASNGHSKSETTEFTFTVGEVSTTLPAPTINNVDTENPAVTLTGTGEPGAQIGLAGGVSATTTVGEDGNWSIDLDLDYGNYEVTATQSLDGETSPSATGSIVVRPSAPKITSPTDGQVFTEENAPSTVSGTGIEGAEVNVTAEGQLAGAMVDAKDGNGSFADAPVAEGEWTVDFGQQFEAGSWTATATQTVNGVESKPATVSFTVEGAVIVPNPNPNPGEGGNGGDELPVTGGDALLPLGLAAGAALLLGGGALALASRRNKAQA